MSDKVTICLISGGIDSAVAAATTKSSDGGSLYVLSVNYGQVMQRELESAGAISRYLRPIAHKVVEILGFSDVSQSARTHESLIERNREGALASGYVPSAYPPGRDLTFLSLAAAWAETL